MKKVIKYKCDYCKKLFDSKKSCLEHESLHEKFYKANQMIKEGYTLKEVQAKYNLWNNIPKHLGNIATDSYIIVGDCDDPNRSTYQIDYIDTNKHIKLKQRV